MTDDARPQRFAQGIETRRQVLGDAWVDRALNNRTAFDAPFQELITEAAWGHVWSRETISKRERSLITLAIPAALGHHEELVLHTKATLNTGASRDDIREAMLHVAIYAGVPAANTAVRIIKQAFSEIDAAEDSQG